MSQFDININSNEEKEELKYKEKIHKAINLIDDFVTKFISKVEYYKLTLQSQLNQVNLKIKNENLLSENKNKENNINNIETENIKNNNQINLNINENENNEYLIKFINSKNFYKKAIYLLFLITEDKSQIRNLIALDKINKEKNKENKFECIKEINTKNFINSITYLKNQNLIAIGMYNFFDGSSIDLYNLDLKIKLSIKKLGSNITELESGELVTCSYNSINIIKLEVNNNENMKYKVVQSLKGKIDSGEILGVLELYSNLISYDWNHIVIWNKIIQNNKNNKNKKRNESNHVVKFREYKSSNFGSDYLININNNEFISHEKGHIIVFYSLNDFEKENRNIIKNINSIGDSMCLINNKQILLIGGNENSLIYIISVEKKELINTIKINDINKYSINKIYFYINKDNKFNILCGGGHNLSDKDVSSDIINIYFSINRDSQEIFYIEEKNIIENAHNSWITGILFLNKLNQNCQEQKINLIFNNNIRSNILKDNIFFISTSHDKKIKFWAKNNNSLI